MPRIDGEHRGPLINVAAWITLVSMILFVASKVATKWRMVRKLQSDDILMIVAMSMAVAQCVAESFKVQSGLGQPESSLRGQMFDHYQKAAYISQVFYVVTIYVAKMAALQFLVILARPNEPDWRRRSVIGLLSLTILWMVIAVFCVAFQCQPPYTWNHAPGKCLNQLAFWIANAAVDIVTQLMIGLAPIYLLFNLQLSSTNKRLAMVAFTPNVTTIPLTILRVIFLVQSYQSTDTTLSAFTPALITVIHTNYSITASCMPFLKPLIDSLAIGLITNDIRVPVERVDESRSSGGGRKNRDKINPFAILGGRGYTTRNVYGWTRFPKDSTYTSEVTGGKENHVELGDLERYGSRDPMVINRTRTTVVLTEPRQMSPIMRANRSSQDS